MSSSIFFEAKTTRSSIFDSSIFALRIRFSSLRRRTSRFLPIVAISSRELIGLWI